MIYPPRLDNHEAGRPQPCPTFDPQTVDILGSVHQSLCLQALHNQSALRQPMSRVFFDYYIHRTNKILSVFQGVTNTFIEKLLPTCRRDSGALSIPHLKGAWFLLQTCRRLPASRLHEDTRTFISELYAYTATLANVTLGIKSDDWISDDMALFLMTKNGPTESSGKISGRIYELFQLIPAVSKLARKRETEEYLQLGTWDTRSSYLSLGRRSYLGNQMSRTKFVQCAVGSTNKHSSSTSSFERFDKSLKDGVDSGSMYSPLVKTSFNSYIELLLSVPVESPISTTLCWPLVVFGSCAKLPEHCDAIRRRLTAMSTVLALVHALEASRLLEILWVKGDSSLAHPLSLEAIIKEENITILFL